MQTRDFLGNVLAVNAASIRQHTEEIGDLYTQPVIAIDKLKQAYGDYHEAMASLWNFKTEGLKTIAKNITELEKLRKKLEGKDDEVDEGEHDYDGYS